MPTELRGGTQTYWREWGTAPQVLLIHCTLAHSGAWKGFASCIKRDAIAFDMPGHGRSGPVDAHLDYQDQVLHVAKDFMRPGMDLVAHSFGATVALRLALEHPGLVRRLVLIEPVLFAAAAGTPEFTRHTTEVAPFTEAMQSGDMAAAAELFTGLWGAGTSWSDLREEQRAGMIEQIPIVARQDTSIYQDRPGVLLPGVLESMSCPCLLLAGGQSPQVVHSINNALAARIPQSQTATIEGGSHMLPITHPDRVAQDVLRFWADHP